MEIKIEDKAEKYIALRGGILTVSEVCACSCGCGEKETITVLSEPQKNINDYGFYECKGIKVYILKHLEEHGNVLEVYLKKNLFKENLHINIK